MVETLYSHELEAKRGRLVGRIAQFVREGGKQSICSKIGDSNYVIEDLEKANLKIPEANGHITLVCEKYPQVCELNLNQVDRYKR